ncbi:DUF4260 domain-containing protein [Shinella oryzae]|uniref:DUF4260 domain-containing protein n=1 Tax=Shinella oryzae TaxID=2871820 RepID=A0ABY9K1E4_9HYPH|nr:DUF4260 domain-containing protein [Shinella oryzae]WLS01608.1 DUF4260 domain-containing protein [Shinella oryzae]
MRKPLSDAFIILLRLEGLAVAAVMIAAYFKLHDGWGLLALLILAPDLSMVGYAFGSRVGAVSYNIVHSYMFAAGVAALGFIWPVLFPVACIWSAHIGLDRALGYGLKSVTVFNETHLGPIGRRR